ncbi:hypothetical protein D1610_07525 [Sphingomonas gilva]|uniref:Uncharacterized protein n=1 Tax=Sphingomonas gilva TaxID=2305907 RepID=A0A396RPK1_9SPHN|nr:hypothetical protein [Sphingomonas gilva]RHW18309.1 hypothetical protein D1610_07525 [Sphingomonas gilva]
MPQPPLAAGGALLKFYHLERPGEPVPEDLAAEARGMLAWAGGEGTLGAGDHGFVLLHRCGADFHFLLVSVWRGANEVWEAVWHHQGAMAGFAPFAPAYPESPNGLDAAPLRPTFCVWELAIVAHEALAWGRLLASDRGEADLARWRADMLAGAV